MNKPAKGQPQAFVPPKYQIGDRLPNTNIYVRGVMTISTSKHRYFLQIGDNSMVVEEENVLKWYPNPTKQTEY